MSSIRKENAKKLAEGYSATKRTVEVCSVLSFCFLYGSEVVRIGRWFVHTNHLHEANDDANNNTTMTVLLVQSVCSFFIAVAAADFFSGVAHWALDTWGSPSTAVFGALIRSFREHHVDQMAITRHDVIETNGDNTMAVLPILLWLCFQPIQSCSLFHSTSSIVLHVFLTSLVLFVALTNQFHKWAHQASPPPLPIRMLMNRSIILSPRNHRVHHSGEFEKYYCITTGWLNYPLDAIGFWRIAEKVITAVTGAIPRADDKDTLFGGESSTQPAPISSPTKK